MDERFKIIVIMGLTCIIQYVCKWDIDAAKTRNDFLDMVKEYKGKGWK